MRVNDSKWVVMIEHEIWAYEIDPKMCLKQLYYKIKKIMDEVD